MGRPSTSSSSNSPRARFVVVAIVAMLAIQLFAVYVSGWSARDSSIDAATRTLDNEADITISRILRFLDPAETVVNDTVRLLDLGVVSVDDTGLEQYLLTRLSSLEHVSSAHVASPDGSFVSVSISPDTASRARYTSSRVTIDGGRRSVTETVYDRSLQPLSSWNSADPGFDPTTRPWYADALASDSLAWTDPYLFFSTDEAGVTASRALSVDDTVAAVVGVDVRLSGLGSIVDDLDVDDDNETYVVAADRIIATDSPAEATAEATAEDAVPDRDGSPALPTSEDVGLPPQSSAAGAGVRGIDSDDGRDLVLSRRFPPADGLDWRLVLRVPESSATGLATSQQSTMLEIMIGGGVLVAVASIVLLRVSRPIDVLVDQATSDPLTGLANRRQIGDEGTRMVERLRPGGHLSVLAIDLDGFKSINDLHGHHLGDEALRVVGDGLQELTRSDDLVGRLGGDEFVVAQQVHDSHEAIEIARRVTDALTDLLREALPECTVGVTGGLTVGDSGTGSFDELLREADASLLSAKAECKGMLRVADRIVDTAV